MLSCFTTPCSMLHSDTSFTPFLQKWRGDTSPPPTMM
jgi:hypothetical protein